MSADKCTMVTGWKAEWNKDRTDFGPGDEIECGKPVWLPGENGGGYCEGCADATAAEGLDTFVPYDARVYVAMKAAAREGYERGRGEAIREATRWLRIESAHVGRVGCAREIEEHEQETAKMREEARGK